MIFPDLLDVPVDGGTLRCARWAPLQAASGAPLVLAAHGITSSWVFWTLAGQALAASGRTLVAADLRGRGDSAALPGPYGIATHARDLVTVLDHLDRRQAVLLGHSMGGFVAATTAAAHPQRVAATVLVDGGAPLSDPLPPDADVDAALHALIGPSLERLSRRFSSVEEYRAFWRAHPAFAAVDDELVDAYADHDLTGEPPALRSKVAAAAVRADAEDILRSPEVLAAFEHLKGPCVFLAAERGMLDQPDALYPPDRLERVVARAGPQVRVVADTNHFTIGLTPHGAAAVADAVVDVTGGGQP